MRRRDNLLLAAWETHPCPDCRRRWVFGGLGRMAFAGLFCRNVDKVDDGFWPQAANTHIEGGINPDEELDQRRNGTRR